MGEEIFPSMTWPGQGNREISDSCACLIRSVNIIARCGIEGLEKSPDRLSCHLITDFAGGWSLVVADPEEKEVFSDTSITCEG